MSDSVEKDLNALDRSLKAIRVDYERFFVGDLKRPPLEARRQIEDRFRKLSNQEIDRVAERFRLQSLEGRYNSMRELWEKRLRAREEGRLAAAAKAASLPPPNAEPPAPVKGRKRVDFTPLFSRYCEARRALGEDVTRLRYDRFEELVRKQAEEIQKRTGSNRLVFEVQTVEGRVRLVGRPAPPKEPKEKP